VICRFGERARAAQVKLLMKLLIGNGRQSLLALLMWLALATAAHAVPGCLALDLGFGLAAVPWIPKAFSRFKRDTRYSLQLDGDSTVLQAQADASASLYATVFKTPLSPAPDMLSWRWKTERLIPGADNRDKDRETPRCASWWPLTATSARCRLQSGGALPCHGPCRASLRLSQCWSMSEANSCRSAPSSLRRIQHR